MSTEIDPKLAERFTLKAFVEACLVLEEGVAGVRDVDLGMMMGTGMIPGPFARADLRDAIEKIAWDAFGPVAEKIVREAIARIEQVAWEVVPKLAETLIQEEIRRLKGNS